MSTVIAYPASRFEVTPSIELGDATSRARVSTASVGAMARLATTWGLTVEQMGTLLGGVAPSTWYSWVKNPPKDLGVDRLTRVSYLLGIDTALHVLYPRSPLADEWVKRPNSNVLFGGRRPLDMLLHGGINGMDRVRSLLDARRGGV